MEDRGTGTPGTKMAGTGKSWKANPKILELLNIAEYSHQVIQELMLSSSMWMCSAGGGVAFAFGQIALV